MLLKLVQGSVGLKAQEIWIENDDRQLTVYCRHDRAEADCALILQTWLKMLSGLSDDPAADLVCGLAHRLADKPALGLSVWEAGTLKAWIGLAGSAPEKVLTSPWKTESGFGVHLQMGSESLKLDASSWVPRLFFCPLPVHHQGKLLGWASLAPCQGQTVLDYYRAGTDANHGSLGARWRGACSVPLGKGIGLPAEVASGKLRNSERTALLRYIGNLGAKEPPGEVTTFQARPDGLRESLQAGRHALSALEFAPNLPVPYCTGALYMAFPDGQRLHKIAICPIKRGVLLEPVELEMPTPTAAVFLPCDDYGTDLSGRLIQAEFLPELSQRAFELVRQGLELCETQKENIHDEAYQAGWLSAGTFAVFGLSLAALGNIPAGLLGLGAAVVAGVAHLFDHSDEREATLRKELARLHQSLHSELAEDPCPACSHTMQACSSGKTCSHCGGVLFDREHAGQAVSRGPSREGSESWSARGLRACPDCHVRLTAPNSLEQPEHCRLCGSVFVE